MLRFVQVKQKALSPYQREPLLSHTMHAYEKQTSHGDQWKTIGTQLSTTNRKARMSEVSCLMCCARSPSDTSMLTHKHILQANPVIAVRQRLSLLSHDSQVAPFDEGQLGITSCSRMLLSIIAVDSIVKTRNLAASHRHLKRAMFIFD